MKWRGKPSWANELIEICNNNVLELLKNQTCLSDWLLQYNLHDQPTLRTWNNMYNSPDAVQLIIDRHLDTLEAH